MSLRLRLVLALTLVAVLPMAVALSVPLLEAHERAKREAEERLALRRQQAIAVIEMNAARAASRIDDAADELRADSAALRALLVGPETATQPLIQRLADRHGLFICGVVDAGGVVLARTASPSEFASTFADFPCDVERARLQEIEPPPPGARERFLAWVGCRTLQTAAEPVRLVAAAPQDFGMVNEIHKLTGEQATLVSPVGDVLGIAGETSEPKLISTEVPLGVSGWRVAVFTRAGDAAEVRREVLSAFVGVAPLALLVALVVGVVLAEGIARPIRALAARADALAKERTLRVPVLLGDHDEIRRLTFSLDRLLSALVDSERQRLSLARIATWEEVARRIAHEVKNPLSPIKLAVENLRRTRERAPNELDRALGEETAVILEEVESLRRLVDEFSQFARMPAPQPAACSPRQVVRSALALFAGRIGDVGVTVAVDDRDAPGTITADPEQLSRALKNVISNALDAMTAAPERRLDIVVRSLPGAASRQVEFEVRDTGVGLTEDAAKRAFEPYFTTRKGAGGTGLGLAIAYRIVADHGGAIEIKSEPGRGATVSIRLPQDGPPCARS